MPVLAQGAAGGDRQHHCTGPAHEPGRAPLGAGHLTGAASPFGKNADQPALTQYLRACQQRGPTRLTPADRHLADPPEEPPHGAREKLLLGEEHRTARQHSEDDRGFQQRAVVGDQHHRPGARHPLAPVHANPEERPEADTADPPADVVQRDAGAFGQPAHRVASAVSLSMPRWLASSASATITWSILSSEVSTCTASSAGRSGEVARLESRRSRRSTEASASASLVPRPAAESCALRRAARISADAVR